MNRTVYDDDKCQAIWKSLVKDVPYDWNLSNSDNLPSKAAQKLAQLLEIDSDDLTAFLSADISVAQKLRSQLSIVLREGSAIKADQVAQWIVSDWGGINRGLEVLPAWIRALEPFDLNSISKFVDDIGIDRISSWSKILAFLDHNAYAIFDSRTSLALNSAMVLAKIRPQFFMPPRKSKKSDFAIIEIKKRTDELLGGYEEYLFLLRRFVELQLAESILDAERKIFAGADHTAQKMLERI